LNEHFWTDSLCLWDLTFAETKVVLTFIAEPNQTFVNKHGNVSRCCYNCSWCAASSETQKSEFLRSAEWWKII